MQRVDDDAYRLALGLATVQLAIQLTDREADERRHARKVAVVTEKWEVLRSAFPVELDDLRGYGGTGPSVRQLADAFRGVTDEWPVAHRRLLLIDVLMGDPFAPYELKVPVDDAVDTLRELAESMGLAADDLDTVWQVWSDALVAYRPSRWRRPNTKVKQIPALAADDFVPPPAPADRLDEVGIRDEAENEPPVQAEHHVALLSGGSLSGAEPDLAGGLWLATFEQETASTADNERVRRLLSLPLAQARTELVKLAMAHALVVCPGYLTTTSTTTVLGALGQLHLAVDDQLEAEQARNDEHAPRIRTLKEVLRAVDVARAHVEQVHDADEAREAAELAALEAAGDLPPIAGSPEPPAELAPTVDDDVAPPPRRLGLATAPDHVGPSVVRRHLTSGPVAVTDGEPQGEVGDGHEIAAESRDDDGSGPAPAGDTTTPRALPADAVDGELVVDFFADTSPPADPDWAPAPIRRSATASLVAAAVADVMAMGAIDIDEIAETPIDDIRPAHSPVAVAAIDDNAPNPLRAPVGAPDTTEQDDEPVDDHPTSSAEPRAQGAA